MSVATESPSPSRSTASNSSADDFAALIDFELDSISNASENHQDDDDQEFESSPDIDFDSEDRPRIKRRKLYDDEESEEQLPIKIEDKPESSSAQACMHPGYMWGVCIKCGQNKPDSEENEQQSRVCLKYIHKEFELSDSEIARLRKDDLKSVLSAKKLYLVLDLDHTLLNSARFIDVHPEEESYVTSTYLVGQRNVESESGDIGRTLYKLPSMHMWTKLRPFVHKFLEEANHMYEMYIYTMGERAYAEKMAKLLDPKGKFFADRIISSSDSTNRRQKDLDVVLGAESAVVILDDTEPVWPKHKSNLIVVERYHFFHASCLQFHCGTKSLTQSKRDEAESEGTLSILLQVLRSVHQRFFDNISNKEMSQFCFDSRDVRLVLKEIRAGILKGCKVVFSRVFPTHFCAETHHLWRLAEELGAICSTSLREDVTHVVSLDSGTDKSRWAVQNDCFLVHPSWIEASSFLWQRQSEDRFPVTKKDSQSSGFVESVSQLPLDSGEDEGLNFHFMR